MGIPVATVCTDEFFALGKTEADCLGMPGLPIAIVPHPVAKLTPDGVAEIADAAVDQIAHLLETESVALAAECEARPLPQRRMRYRGLFSGDFTAENAPVRFSGPDGFEQVNRVFYERGWTDGLPVVPPTVERWEAMLAATDLAPETDLGIIEPRLGRATVANVAANAVMAGCTPPMLPLLIAATRALSEPRLNLKALQATTHPCTVMMAVNGPIVEALDINAGTNAMGQGVLANSTLGRALRLILTNVGGGQPGILDRSTMGTPAKFAFCFAENMEASPFPSLATERGFADGTSTVTLAGCEGPHNVNDHYGITAEAVLLTIAGTMATPGCNNSYFHSEYFVVLGPEHAEIIARDGFTKEDVKRFLFERAIIPRWHINEAQMALYRDRIPERLLGADGSDGARIASSPDEIVVLVAGGAGRHSCVIPTFGNTLSVTVPV